MGLRDDVGEVAGGDLQPQAGHEPDAALRRSRLNRQAWPIGRAPGSITLPALLVTAAAGAAIVLAVPGHELRSLSARVALETLVGAIGVMVGLVSLSRYARERTSANLALVLALGVGAVSALTLFTVPALLDDAAGRLLVSARTVDALLGSALLCFAAFVSNAPLDRAWSPRRAALAVLVLAAGAAGVGALLGAALPQLATDSARGRALMLNETPFIVVESIAIVLGLAATVGFFRRWRLTGDPLVQGLSFSCLLGAFMRVELVVAGVKTPVWTAGASVLRASSFFVLLVAAAFEVRAVHRRDQEAAVIEERMRLARELHDGVAQDLAFIAGQTRELAASSADAKVLRWIAEAADRALSDSRDAIQMLRRPRSQSLGIAVRQRAFELAERAGLKLVLEVDDELEADPEIEHAVLRIIEEAMSNIARHGHASTAMISLTASDGNLVARIADDGRGFVPRKITPTRDGGLGLLSMAERAYSIGGELRLQSEPGRGTKIEVAVP
jgi:signal transduction histidine kinase